MEKGTAESYSAIPNVERHMGAKILYLPQKMHKLAEVRFAP